MVNPIDETFPGLRPGNYQITSPASNRYNCVAWAAGDEQHWWQPDETGIDYWPQGEIREETLSAFQAVFATLGYVRCADENLEVGSEKIALFVDATGIPTHAARQLSNGAWTSKLGGRQDIQHALHDLKGEAYGMVAEIMKRPAILVPTEASSRKKP